MKQGGVMPAERPSKPPPSTPGESHELATFAHGPTLEARLEALRALQTTRRLSAAVTGGPLFLTGLVWLENAATESSSSGRFAAFCALLRLRSLSKAIELRVDQCAARALVDELPRLDGVDPEDRVRVCEAIRRATPVWGPAYLARVLLNETTTESKTRQAALEALFAQLGSLDSVAEQLLAVSTDALRMWGTPENISRQIGYTLRGLRSVWRDSGTPAGDDAPQALEKLGRVLRDRAEKTAQTEGWKRAAESLTLLVCDVARARLRVGEQASSYAALRQLRASGGQNWKAFATSSEAIRSARGMICDALLARAQVGIPDAELRELLKVVAGSPDEADLLARELAQNASLPPAMQAWLRGEEAPMASTGDGHALQAEAELPRVANAFRDAVLLEQTADHVRRSASDELRFVAPRLEMLLARQHNQVLSLVGHVKLLAADRGLHIVGSPGEVVDYDPMRHELAGTIPQRGIRRIILQLPAVEQKGDDGVVRVILKALAQPEEVS